MTRPQHYRDLDHKGYDLTTNIKLDGATASYADQDILHDIISDLDDQVSSGGVGLALHLADTIDAHDASAISILDSANRYTSTQVEGALTEVVTKADDEAVNIVIDGGAAVITAGVKAAFQMPRAGTIRANRVMSTKNETGSIVFDVWKNTYAGGPPTAFDTITASAKPTVTAAKKSENTVLTGWTTTFLAGDWLVVSIDSISAFTGIVLSLTIDWS